MSRAAVRSVLIATIGTLLLASSTLAARPSRAPLDLPSDNLLQGVCAFDVNVHNDFNGEFETTWTDAAGNLRAYAVNGALRVTVTNLETGESIRANISGPLRLVYDVNRVSPRNTSVPPYRSGFSPGCR